MRRILLSSAFAAVFSLACAFHPVRPLFLRPLPFRFRFPRLPFTSMKAATAPSDEAKRLYESLCEKLRKVSYLEGVQGLVSWDELVMMPPGSENSRGKQKGALASAIHEKKTDKEIGELLEKLEPFAHTFDEFSRANLREAKLKFERNVRIPVALAQRCAELETTGYGAWVGYSNYGLQISISYPLLSL